MAQIIYFVLDTNIWLYLANGLDSFSQKHHESHHFTLLDTFKELTTKGEIRVVVNDIITTEWERNKDQAYAQIKKLKNQLNDSNAYLEKLKIIGGNQVDKEVDKLSSVIAQKIQERISRNEQHIQNVEDFIYNQCRRIEISDELKIKIFDLSVSKKVPFHNKKNNIADAAILLSATEYIEQILSPEEGDYAIFVTNNYEDFTDGINKDQLHPELLKLLPTSYIELKRHLPAAFKKRELILAELEEFRRMEAYYASIAFYCYNSCEVQDDYFHSYGYFESDVLIEITGEYIKKTETTTKFGSCNYCGTLHIKCPICQSVVGNVIFNNTFKCNKCNAIFEYKGINAHEDIKRFLVKNP